MNTSKPLQVGEIEELLRLVIQVIDKTMEQFLKILEQIATALMESLPNQD